MSTRTRTYDEIHADLSAAYASWQDIPVIEMRERLHHLWDEIAQQASRDREMPGWVALAVVLALVEWMAAAIAPDFSRRGGRGEA